MRGLMQTIAGGMAYATMITDFDLPASVTRRCGKVEVLLRRPLSICGAIGCRIGHSHGFSCPISNVLLLTVVAVVVVVVLTALPVLVLLTMLLFHLLFLLVFLFLCLFLMLLNALLLELMLLALFLFLCLLSLCCMLIFLFVLLLILVPTVLRALVLPVLRVLFP